MTAEAPGLPIPPADHSTAPPLSGNRPSSAITTNCCDAWWTGLSAAHCSACHTTFTGVTAFDLHRRDGKCLNPADIGLVLTGRAWPGWGWPGTWAGPDE